MLQRNKLNPFSLALISVFTTFLLFAFFGYNGWGPAAANEQAIGEISRWCERVSSGFFREPANTLGNLGFVVVGLYMFFRLSKDATRGNTPLFGSFKIALLYASASTFLGPASMAMHGTHTRFGAWLDNVSMISYVLILWIYNLKKLTKFSSRSFFITYSGLLAYYAYLCQRGLYTLGPRLAMHSANAHKLAEYLENSEHIKEVYYPGLQSNPHYLIAEKQMDMFGGMLSFNVENHINLKLFWENLELFKLAVSLGGVESLIELPRLMTHDSAEGTEASIDDDLVRISVGLENTEDLISDLESALNAAKK